MNDDRLIELETRITYQDDTIRQLNDAVSRQQLDIARLERLCATLQSRLAAMIEAAPREPAGDEKPPHY
jgi:SlyX protein